MAYWLWLLGKREVVVVAMSAWHVLVIVYRLDVCKTRPSCLLDSYCLVLDLGLDEHTEMLSGYLAYGSALIWANELIFYAF